jgi:hypothetical protein
MIGRETRIYLDTIWRRAPARARWRSLRRNDAVSVSGEARPAASTKLCWSLSCGEGSDPRRALLE